MNEQTICPACWHDMCKDCIGSGCYCDCQIDAWPTVESDYEPADSGSCPCGEDTCVGEDCEYK